MRKRANVMDMPVTHRYDYALGPIETGHLEVLKDRYGRITKRRWRKERQYAIELATLDPAPSQTTHIAWKLLLTAVVSLAGLGGVIAYLYYGNGYLPLLAVAGTALPLLGLTVLCSYLFFWLSRRRVTFHTRFSGTPLIEIPFPLRQRGAGAVFAEELGKLVNENRKRLLYNDDELRAGELRMLRRLSTEGVIDAITYDNAKTLLLRLSS